jgi:hypothetical protein
MFGRGLSAVSGGGRTFGLSAVLVGAPVKNETDSEIVW